MEYLVSILGAYLSERVVIAKLSNSNPVRRDVTCGVPQGFVLDPDL